MNRLASASIAALLLCSLAACATRPTITPTSSLVDLAAVLAADQGSRGAFVPSRTSALLSFESQWRLGRPAASARFRQWCDLRGGSYTDADVALATQGEAGRYFSDSEHALELVLYSEKKSPNSFFRTMYCAAGGDSAILGFNPPTMDREKYGDGSSLYLITKAELAKISPPLVAAYQQRNRDNVAALAVQREKGKRDEAAAREQNKRDKALTNAALAAYKKGARILCTARVSSRGDVQEFYCDKLPTPLSPEKLILAGWDVVSKEQNDEWARIILRKD